MHRRYLAALLVLSGFCGLAYELIWVRMLSLSFGSTTLSFSTVIAVFLGGLALGSWLCGRSKRALANPVRTYAILEIATGVIGLALYPVLRALPEAFSYVDPGVAATGAFVRGLTACLVLAPPTLLMGATLPVACAACIRDDATLGTSTATIYGLNTLGACLGAYGITFVLLPTLGTAGSIAVIAVLNLLVGGVTLAFERAGVDFDATRQHPAPAVERPIQPLPNDASVRNLTTVLSFLAGFSAITAQVVWARAFSSFLEGTLYGVGSVLVAVLVGVGTGSLVVSRTRMIDDRSATSLVCAEIILLLSLLALWAAFPVIQYTLQSGLGSLSGTQLVHAQLAVTVLALVVPCAASGATLPILLRVGESHARGVPRTLSRLYAANTVGCVAASIIAGFYLLPMIGIAGTAFVATLLVAISGVATAVLLLRDRRLTGLAYALAFVVPMAVFPEIDAVRTTVPATPDQSFRAHSAAVARRHQMVTYVREGQAATVVVYSDDETNSLTLDGLGQGAWLERVPHHLLESLLVALVPAVHARESTRALVIGLGAGVTVQALDELGFQRIRVVELEAGVVEAQPYVFGDTTPSIASPRVEVVVDDARHHLLLNLRSGERFDVITSMPAHPWVAANVFTQEFFEIARDNLRPSGVFTTWFGKKRMDDETFASILRAFAAAFPHYVVYDIREAGALFIVGSREAIVLEPERVEDLGRLPLVEAHASGMDSVLFFTTRMLGAGASGDELPAGVVNTDETLFAEARSPLVDSATISSEGLLPRTGFVPGLVPAGRRTDVAVETFEALLGTPSGMLPLWAPRSDLPRAAALASSLSLPPDVAAYMQARLMLARGEAASVEALQAVGRGSGTLADRARAFAATAAEDPATREATFAELTRGQRGRADVWLRALDGPASAEAIALAEAASQSAGGSASPLDATAWLIAAARGSGAVPDLSNALLRELGSLVAQATDTDLSVLCSKAAERAARPDLMEHCRGVSHNLARRQARAQLQRAARLREGQRFVEALVATEQAATAEPLDSATLESYLSTAVRAGDEVRARAAADQLRLRGMPESVVADRIARARAQSEKM